MASDDTSPKITVTDRLEYAALMAVLVPLLALPLRWRVPVAGAVVARVAAPLLGWNTRIAAHLDLAMPDLDPSEKARLLRAIPQHLGRFFIELMSPRAMADVAAAAPFGGAGVAALDAALAQGAPVICVSGHFGNYDVFRAALVQRGFDVGALYRPLNNPLINARYERAVFSVGGQMYARGRRGFAQMVKHLRGGHLLALLVDQHMDRGARLTFFGQPAYTAVSAAQMALKYDAILVPIYAVRQSDGLSYAIEAEAPVPHTDEETMTQALNDSLEAQVRKHPDQWLWTHRRWKNRAVGQRATK